MSTGILTLTVTAGAAEQNAFSLTPGERVEPLSVGRGGAWRVDGPGVPEVGAYLFFDGALLFCASADPTCPVRVNGRPIAADWVPLSAPSEISIGGVCLALGEYTVDSPSPSPSPGRARAPSDATRLLRDEPPSAPRPAASAPRPSPARSVGEPKASRPSLRNGGRSSVRPVIDDEATRFSPVDMGASGATPAVDAAFDGRAGRTPIPEPRGDAPFRSPLPAAGSPPPQRADFGPPPVVISDGPTTAAPLWPDPNAGALFGGAVNQAPGGSLGPIGAAPGPFGAPPGVPFGAPDPAGFPFSSPGPTIPFGAFAPAGGSSGEPMPTVIVQRQPSLPGTPATGGARGLLERFKTDWRASSIPRKISVLLLPFAIYAAYGLAVPIGQPAVSDAVKGDRPTPPVTPSAAPPASTMTAPKPDASIPSVDGLPPASGSASAAAPPSSKPPVGKKATPKTAEREAVEAVDAGNTAQAARLYSELAAAHPDQRAYAEAARILRAKAAGANP